MKGTGENTALIFFIGCFTFTFLDINASQKLPALSTNKIPKQFQTNAQTLSGKEIEELKRKEECPTFAQFRVSTPIRKHCYRALKKSGISHPHLIYIINDPSAGFMCQSGYQRINGHEVMRIHFTENYWKDFKTGVTQIVLSHEGAHIQKDDHVHRPKSHIEYQKRENNRDEMAATAINCRECIFEAAEYFFNGAKHEQYQHPRLKELIALRTFKSLNESASCDKIADFIVLAAWESKLDNQHHPLFLERALRFIKFARAITGNCELHCPKTVFPAIPNKPKIPEKKLWTLPHLTKPMSSVQMGQVKFAKKVIG